MSTPRTHTKDDSAAPHAGDGTIDAEFTVVNEFTAVRVRKILTRNGQRLEITSLRLDHQIRLDALALEALSWQNEETISAYLDQPFGPEDPPTTEIGKENN
ncbi:dihydrodiol dehydrogenase [Rhodococcus sp. NPDC059968]|uniref:dihydrodiol dehydrogenase n=1 Tax=Rhodococcus sp. NPDC059968 TaxID=3347017 RepID=UPI00366FAE81